MGMDLPFGSGVPVEGLAGMEGLEVLRCPPPILSCPPAAPLDKKKTPFPPECGLESLELLEKVERVTL